MAGLDERYVLSAPLEIYLVNKDSGLPLANGTLTFYRDSARNTPKTVYELTGTPPDYTYTALPNPIELSAVGTVQNAGGDNVVIYYFPYDDDGNLDLYYIVCRDADGVEQFTREGWPNISASNDPVDEDQTGLSNQISNPQFSEVFINTSSGLTTTYTVSGSSGTAFAVAPDWDIVLVGTGSVIVYRVPVAGSGHVATSPAYVLDVEVGGVSACYLRQRFNVNSGLWATTNNQTVDGVVSESVFLSGALVAKSVAGSNVGISITYVPSYFTGLDTPIEILNASLQTGNFQYIADATDNEIPLSNDSLSGSSGYIDIRVNFAPNSHVQLSSIQVIPTTGNDDGGNVLPYDLQSTNREMAYLGDYFTPRAAAKTNPSLLIGWDFPLNPAQFGETGTAPVAAAADYIWDQTIAVDLPGTATYARSTTTGGLQVTTNSANSAFYLLQYLTGAQAKKILGTRLAVNVFGYKGTVGSDVTMKVYLYRGSTASGSIPTLPTTIGTVDTLGVFTLTAANWSLIPRTGLNTATTTLNAITADNNTINSAANNYGFSQWEVIDSATIADTDKFAVVVTFAYISAATVITVNSVSVVPGDLPCRPAVQSYEQVLGDCRYYYEKSYEFATAPGTITNTGVVFVPAPLKATGGGLNALTYHSFPVNYISKRIPPTFTFYSPASATPGLIRISGWATGAYAAPSDQAIAGWTVISKTVDSAWLSPNSSANISTFAETDSVEGILVYHFVADARLGK